MKTYNNFEDACRDSKQRKAVGNIRIEMPQHPAGFIEADIIKPIIGDAMIYHQGTAFPIRKATTREIDSIRHWRPYV